MDESAELKELCRYMTQEKQMEEKDRRVSLRRLISIYEKSIVSGDQLENHKELSMICFNITQLMDTYDIIVINGNVYYRNNMYIRSIELDPDNGYTLAKIGMSPTFSAVVTATGFRMEKVDCLIKAVNILPVTHETAAYCVRIAEYIGPFKGVDIARYGNVTRNKLCEIAIEIDPTCKAAYIILIENNRRNIYQNEYIRDVILSGISVIHDYKPFYSYLLMYMRDDELITFNDGRRLYKEQIRTMAYSA